MADFNQGYGMYGNNNNGGGMNFDNFNSGFDANSFDQGFNPNQQQQQQQQQQQPPQPQQSFQNNPFQSQPMNMNMNGHNPNPMGQPMQPMAQPMQHMSQPMVQPMQGMGQPQPQQPQQPQQPMADLFGGMGGGFGAAAPLVTAMVPGMAGINFEQKQQQVEAKVNTLKYYFQVNTSYVGYKIKLLLFPYMHKEWQRRQTDNVFMTPANDINAPDLYTPVMAFVTFVLLVGIYFGNNEKFSPEQLGIVTTSSLLWLLFEVGVIFFAFYILNVSGSYTFLDLLCYFGYKFVSLCIILACMVFSGGDETAYYVCWIAVSLPYAFYLMRTLRHVTQAPQTDQFSQSSPVRNYALIAVALFQIPFIYFLSNFPK